MLISASQVSGIRSGCKIVSLSLEMQAIICEDVNVLTSLAMYAPQKTPVMEQFWFFREKVLSARVERAYFFTIQHHTLSKTMFAGIFSIVPPTKPTTTMRPFQLMTLSEGLIIPTGS